MQNNRWYDHDPTLSMAVSLLQNAPEPDQLSAIEEMLRLLAEDERVTTSVMEPKLKLSFFLLPYRRKGLNQEAWRFLEILKQLPSDIQMDMAFHIIHYLYTLECHNVQERVNHSR